MMFGYGHDFSAWGWVGMILGMVAFWALVVVAVVWLVRSLDQRQPGSPSAPLPGPEQVLAERFARGEVDEHEFSDRLATLRGVRRPAVRS
ncbi:UNVERIFIED_ORG: SHOCT domain-containing protein [Bacillus sp. AZ43]